MADEATGQVTDGYCVVEQPGREIKSGPNLAGGRFVQTASERVHDTAMVHAVKVTAGILQEGTDPKTVTTACGLQMPRQKVRQNRSWEQQLDVPVNDDYLGGQLPPCEQCKALART
jgi:hypothetical protein